MKTPRSTWRVVMQSLALVNRSERGLLLLALTLGCMIAVLEVLVAGLIALLSGVISMGARAGRAELDSLESLSQVADAISDGTTRGLILSCLGLVISTLVVRALFTLAYHWYSASLAERVSGLCRAKLISLYQQAPTLWLEEESFADRQFNVGATSTISGLISQTLHLLTSGVMLGTLVIGFTVASPAQSSIFVFGAALIGAALIKGMKRALAQQSEAVMSDELTVTTLTHIALQGLREMRLFQREGALTQRILETLERFMRGRARQQTLAVAPTLSLELIGFTILFLIAYVLGEREGLSLTALSAQLGLFAATAWRALPLMNRILAGASALEVMRPYLDRINDLIHDLESLDDQWPLEPTDLKRGPSEQKTERRLIVRDLTFQYPRSPQVLEDRAYLIDGLSFDLSPGQSLAIVGASGVGKSTLAQLLAGLIPLNGGSITLNGDTISDAKWLNRVHYIPQNPCLFDLSLADNIQLSTWLEPEQERAEERLHESCQRASINFIDELEEGFDTRMGEAGNRLSGGQAQRVTIARALYHAPELLILDESTSAIDAEVESSVIDALLKALNDPSDPLTYLILITHDKALADRCDAKLRLGAVAGKH